MGLRIKTKERNNANDEWRFSNQNWKGVLNEISDYAPNRYGRGKGNYGADHPLVRRLKITSYELMLIMSFLEEQGLIEYDKTEHNWINLTSKGFDVALQNQSAARTARMNRIAIFFSAAIALFVVVNLLLGIENIIMKWAVTAVIAGGLISVGFLIRKM